MWRRDIEPPTGLHLSGDDLFVDPNVSSTEYASVHIDEAVQLAMYGGDFLWVRVCMQAYASFVRKGWDPPDSLKLFADTAGIGALGVLVGDLWERLAKEENRSAKAKQQAIEAGRKGGSRPKTCVGIQNAVVADMKDFKAANDSLPTNEQLRRRLWIQSERVYVVNGQEYEIYVDGERLCEVNRDTLQEKSISRNTLPVYTKRAREILSQ